MKKLSLILAAFGMAAMLSACGDDSSSSPSDNGGQGKPSTGNVVSCDIQMEFIGLTSRSCVEAPAGSAELKELEEGCVSQPEVGVFATKGSGCPSGATKVCQKPGTKASAYFYDEDAASMSCDDLISDDED